MQRAVGPKADRFLRHDNGDRLAQTRVDYYKSGMFTIAIPSYNNPVFTRKAVESAIRATEHIDLPTEFILIDDAADSGESATEVFLDVRNAYAERDIVVVRATTRVHYPGSFSLALHLTKTPLTMFMSNDMLLTPSYLLAALGVTALNKSFGCVRGSSGYTDGLPQHVVKSPYSTECYEAAASFGDYIFRHNGLAYVDNYLLCGDAVIIRGSY